MSLTLNQKLNSISTTTDKLQLNAQLVFNNSGAIVLPEGNTSAQDPNATSGLLYNTASSRLEQYYGNTWHKVGTVDGIADIDEFNFTGVLDQDFLQYNDAQQEFQAVRPSITLLNDVDISGITDTQMLQWDGSKFSPVDPLSIKVNGVSISTNAFELMFNGVGIGAEANAQGEVAFTFTQSIFANQDFSLPNPIPNESFIQWNSATTKFETVANSLNNLNDIDLTGVQDGDFLKWDGAASKVVPRSGGIDTDAVDEGSTNLYYTDARADARATTKIDEWADQTSISRFVDVDLTNIKQNDVIKWDVSSQRFRPASDEEGLQNIAGLGDVDITGIQVNDILKWGGNKFYPDAFSTDIVVEDSGATNLYFTQERSRLSISGTQTGGLGTFSYDQQTGAFSYAGVTQLEIRNLFSSAGDLAFNNATGEFSVTTYKTADFTTDYGTAIAATTFDTLSDVDMTGVTTGQVVKWDGSNFVPGDDIDTGEDNTASNVGTGTANTEGLFKQKAGVDLEFKSIFPGAGINLYDRGDYVEISNTIAEYQEVGEANTGSNITDNFGDIGVFYGKTGVDLRFKGIRPGEGIEIVDKGNAVEIVNSASTISVDDIIAYALVLGG